MNLGDGSVEKVRRFFVESDGEEAEVPTDSGVPFGRYILTREIARGGMGIIYEAYDPELRRRVAIKVLKEEWATPEIVERFHREATIAAQLRHPNIVHVFEVGTLDDGGGHPAHFIAMEYVEGTTLAALLAKRRATRSELIRIVEVVARAVGHAHEKGVIHRDLKPANVLVEPTGKKGDPPRIVLTDFGLAHAELFETQLTRTQAVMGTPNYMAPEQVEGRTQEIDARTDVYALGVMLYEVVTGRPPYRGHSPAQLFDRILHSEPRRPRQLDRSVEWDLELICLRAMEKDRRRRYGSAQGFAEDLARFLRGEAIEARPPSLVYRFKKGLRRWRILVWSVIVVLGVSGGVAWGMREVQFRRLRAEAQTAYHAKEWQKAYSICEQALAIRDDQDLQRILGLAKRQLDEERAAAEEAAWLRELRRITLEPLEERIRQTRPLFYIASIDIRSHLEKVALALEELEKLSEDPRAQRSADVWTYLGIGWYFLGSVERAERALDVAQKISPASGRIHYFQAKVCVHRAIDELLGWDPSAEAMQRRRAAAKVLYEKALAHFEESRQAWDGAEEIDVHLTRTYLALAEGREETARSLSEEGLQRFAKELGREEYWCILALLEKGDARIQYFTSAVECRPHYPWALYMRALARWGNGDEKGAVADATEALKINPKYEDALSLRGTLRVKMGEVAEGMADYDRAVELNPRSYACRQNRGIAREEQGDLDGALADLTEAIRIDPTVSPAYFNRAGVRLKKKDLKGAIEDYDQCLKMDARDAQALEGRGLARGQLGDYDGAIQDLTAALAIDEKLHRSYLNRGVALAQKGDFAGAMNDYTLALKWWPIYLEGYLNRGALKEQLGDLDGALEDYDHALSLHSSSVEGYVHRARVRLKKGQYPGSLEDCNEALRLKPGQPEVLNIRAAARWKLGDREGALVGFAEAIAADPRHVQAFSNRGQLRMELARFAEAVEDFTKALDYGGTAFECYINRGTCYVKLGKHDLAETDFTSAITLDQSSPGAFMNRGLVREMRGDREKAAADFSEALRLAPADWPFRVQVEERLKRLTRNP